MPPCVVVVVVFVLLIASCAFTAKPSAGAAANFSDSIITAASRDLLELEERVRNKEDFTSETVVKAYEGYVRLYEIQAGLAAASSSGTDDNQLYGRINDVLSKPGINVIAEILFEPLHGTTTIGERQQAKITKAIDELRATM